MTKRSPTARPYVDRIPKIPRGPLAPAVLAECRSWMTGQGYAQGTTQIIVNLLERLSAWMHSEGTGIDGICEELLERFVAYEQSRPVIATSVHTGIGTLRRFLAAVGYLPPAPTQAPVTQTQVDLAQWGAWMRTVNGLGEKTVRRNKYFAAGLIDLMTSDEGMVQWSCVDAALVNTYVTERGRPYGEVARALIIGAVRCLLRWALSTGRLEHDPSAGILKPRGTKRTVPRGVTAEHVAALMHACDQATVIGARDLAVLTLLVRLGLRAGEAAGLTLDDIDWSNGRLTVSGKGREHTLPIPVDVGQALESWLRVRPDSLDRALFVRAKAPHQMMAANSLSGIIARLSNHAGIEQLYAHRLRHTAAMDVLAAGGTLIEARELLGHSHTMTTMTYAKVDLVSLRSLVVPFGQVPR